MINAVVLAAGASERMGKPKPLLKFRDRTFLEQIIAVLKLSDADRITVVLGAKAETIKKSVDLSGTDVVINKHYQKGQLSSLAVAIENAPPQTDAILVCLVDMPFITAEVVNKIIAKFRQTNAAIIVPVFDKNRGHPTLFARSVFSELLSAPPDQSARYVLYSNSPREKKFPRPGKRPFGGTFSRGKQRIVELQTSDSGILIHIDTPDDYRLHFGAEPMLADNRAGQRSQKSEDRRQKSVLCHLSSVICFLSAAKWVWKLIQVIVISVAVKGLLAHYFPFMGDEAYFTLWGKHISAGYYDHPPMIGWLLHLLLYIGQSPLILRSLPIVFSTAVGVGLYLLLADYDQRKAYLVSLLFIVSPINTAFFMVTTDTPLLLFSFISAFLLFKAESNPQTTEDREQTTEDGLLSSDFCLLTSRQRRAWRGYLCYFFSGVFWGIAFLSKYFALLMAFSYIVYFLSVRKCVRRGIGILLFALGAIPFVAQNVLWNYQNGWPNIMHNWFNRLESDSNPVINLLCLGLFAVYLLTPPVVWFLFKNRTRLLHVLWKENLSTALGPGPSRFVLDRNEPPLLRLAKQNGGGAGFRIFTLASMVPLCAFAVGSFKKTVGLHWYMSFLPCAFVIVALILDADQIVKSIKISIGLSLIQVCLFLVVPFIPLGNLKGLINQRDLASLVLYIHPEKVIASLDKYKGNFVFGTRSYSTSAILSYYCGQRVIVFGKGSRHARHDDILTDFKQLDGKNMLILERGKVEEGRYSCCFEKVQIKPLAPAFGENPRWYGGKFTPWHGHLGRDFTGWKPVPQAGEFSVVLGYSFKYEEYRQKYLRDVLRAYYQVPAWLPHANNFFREKYDF